MERIAKFEKVSKFQFVTDYKPLFPGRGEPIWESIVLPRRATTGSAGYDFYAPFDFELAPGQVITIPTGIRARISDGWALFIFPRSGLGFKYRMQLNNTVGIIDSDYYNSSNEGHIMIKLTNDTVDGRTIRIKAGQGFAQGVFLPFGITEDDDADGLRDGGFGSTTK